MVLYSFVTTADLCAELCARRGIDRGDPARLEGQAGRRASWSSHFTDRRRERVCRPEGTLIRRGAEPKKFFAAFCWGVCVCATCPRFLAVSRKIIGFDQREENNPARLFIFRSRPRTWPPVVVWGRSRVTEASSGT